jgi:acyl-CoA thioester hydrolase
MNDHSPDTVPPGGHRYTLRVYYDDTDAGGVVYHANYLRFAERARIEAMRDLGVSHAEMASQCGLLFMVRRVKLDYLAPARLDDSLLVVTRMLAARAASMEFGQTFYRQGEDRPLVVLVVQVACVRESDQRPARVPERWRAALMSLA